jgi:hypothetical protein
MNKITFYILIYTSIYIHFIKLLLAQQCQQSCVDVSSMDMKQVIRPIMKQAQPFNSSVLEGELALTASCIKKQVSKKKKK